MNQTPLLTDPILERLDRIEAKLNTALHQRELAVEQELQDLLDEENGDA